MNQNQENILFEHTQKNILEIFGQVLKGKENCTYEKFKELIKNHLKWEVGEEQLKELFQEISYSESFVTLKQLEDFGDWNALQQNYDQKTSTNKFKEVCLPHLPKEIPHPWFLWIVSPNEDLSMKMKTHLMESKLLDGFAVLPNNNEPCQQYCIENKFNISKFISGFEQWKKELSQAKKQAREVGANYRFGLVLCNHGNEVDGNEVDGNEVDAKELFEMNLTGQLDLITWCTASINSTTPPKVIRVLSNVPLQREGGCWVQSFGSLLSIDLTKRKNPSDTQQVFHVTPSLVNYSFQKKEEEKPKLLEPSCPVENPQIVITPCNGKGSFEGPINALKEASKVQKIWTRAGFKSKGVDLKSIQENETATNNGMDKSKGVDLKSIRENKTATKNRMDCVIQQKENEFASDLKNKFGWLLACHGSSETFILDNRYMEHNRILSFCKNNSKGLGNGELQLVFLNACGCEEIKAFAQRLSEEAKIPFVIYWTTKCNTEAAKFLSESFFQRLAIEFKSDQWKSLTSCITTSFENAKEDVEQTMYQETNQMGENILKLFYKWKFQDPNIPLTKIGVPSDRQLQAIGCVELLNTYVEIQPCQFYSVHPKNDLTVDHGDLKFSPSCPMTLEGVAREKALIPPQAHKVAYCYPPTKVNGIRFETEVDKNFEKYGGFVYFDKDGAILQINVLSKSNLANGGPSGILTYSKTNHNPNKDVIHLLHHANRLNENDKVSWAWILPREIISLSMSVGSFVQKCGEKYIYYMIMLA